MSSINVLIVYYIVRDVANDHVRDIISTTMVMVEKERARGPEQGEQNKPGPERVQVGKNTGAGQHATTN